MLLNTDSYKYSHFLQYPPGTEYISSYIEARGGRYKDLVFFGLQIYLKEYLSKPFTKYDIEEAKDIVLAHGLPFNTEGFAHILDKHGGYFPVEIEAVAEGSIVPIQNVLVQIQNTDTLCAWVTSYLETSLLRAVWYPSTVATLSWHAKKIIKQYLDKTSDNPQTLSYKLHDFGARGASSLETAGIGGAAHLVNFTSTDTVAGLVCARKYYNEKMAGFSAPAAEHSTITSWGKDGEVAAYRNMLTQFAGKDKILAVVTDSYNIWHALEHIWGGELKEQVVNCGGTIVIRPDSGDPIFVVTQVIAMLIAKFGYSVNSKGYKLLPPYIRVIQGDGISLVTINAILEAMEQKKYSAENVTFGMGGGLLQKVSRDTMEFAMKASSICISGEWRDVYKDPVTDSRKKSKKGHLALIKKPKIGYKTIRKDELHAQENLLLPVFKDGKLLREWSFAEVREKTGL
ncbi:MAG: hypothetical protein RIT35_318 [Pseudomonadota bacterium]|jgi:nicotinamide phosphoribosyltransferase